MIPSELRYTREHEWVKVEGNIAIVGITHFAQDQLGDIVYVDILHNQDLKKDEIFGTIEAVKTVSDLFMPLSGKVIDINPFLDKNPELVNTDTYGDGWMVAIQMSDPSEISTLLTLDSMIEGNIGSSIKMDYTVLGHTVDQAVNLGALARDLHKPLAVSKSIQLSADSSWGFCSVGECSFNEPNESTQVYALTEL